jgi:hypothetical protein
LRREPAGFEIGILTLEQFRGSRRVLSSQLLIILIRQITRVVLAVKILEGHQQVLTLLVA